MGIGRFFKKVGKGFSKAGKLFKKGNFNQHYSTTKYFNPPH